jgi:hypothetical protein
MGMLDLFDEAFDLYKKNFALFVLITAVVYVPAVGISTYYILPAAHDMFTSMPGDFDAIVGWIGPYVGSLVIATPLYSMVAALLINSLIAAVSARYLMEPITMREAFKQGASVTLQSTLAFTLYIALVFVSYIMCVVPGIIVQMCCIPLQFFIHVMVNEKKPNVFKALGRSWNIVKTQGSLLSFGHTVHWILWSVLMLATFGVVQVIAQVAVNSAIPFLPLLGSHKDLAETIGLEISWMLLLPFQVCVVTMFYYDLKIRKEGYDMEVLAHSLGYPDVSLPAQAVSSAMRRGRK